MDKFSTPIRKWVWILLFALTSAGADDDCAPVDLRSSGESLAGISETSQGNVTTNLCGFYSAATMLDAWRDAGTVTKIDPIGFGVDHAIKRNLPVGFPIQNSTDPLSNASLRAGSTVCALLRAARKEGACLDRTGDAADFATSALRADKGIAVYAVLGKFGKLSRRHREEQVDATVDDLLRLDAEMPPKSRTAFDRTTLRASLLANAKHPYRIVRDLLYPGCAEPGNRVALDDLPVCRSSLSLAPIDRGLNRPRPIPVSFAYCARALWEGAGVLKPFPIPKECALHWSLVIGRKRVGERCYYLVRNTYHPERPYHSSFIQDGYDLWIARGDLKRMKLLVQSLGVSESESK